MTQRYAIVGAEIFDGEKRIRDHALLIEEDRIAAIVPERALAGDLARIEANGLIAAPGFIDLQVNGGGGVLFNNEPTADGIARICAAHARFGTTALLVTLITDTPAVMARAIAAGITAHHARLPGFLGLHLEGPHLSLARKGTHDPTLIRPMTAEDRESLGSPARFGHGLVTVAPESVTPGDVAALVAAGYRVSLGHSDAGYETARAYAQAGATMVTHLFNAMSQLGNREPGMVGAALDLAAIDCGLIADGFHVHPASMAAALRAKRGPGRIFLVTDAMATIGTDLDGFTLNGREVYRRDGRLTLVDGTLAGADIDMIACVRNARRLIGVDVEEALRMASLYPAEAIGAATKGRLVPGADADIVLLTETLDLAATFIAGNCVHDARPAQSAERQFR